MKKIIILLTVNILVVIGFAFAQPPQGPPPFGAERPKPEQVAKMQTAQLKKELGLTAAQEKKIYQLHLNEAQKREALFIKAQKEHEAMEAQLKKILTAEQWGKFEQMAKERNGMPPRPPLPAGGRDLPEKKQSSN